MKKAVLIVAILISLVVGLIIGMALFGSNKTCQTCNHQESVRFDLDNQKFGHYNDESMSYWIGTSECKDEFSKKFSDNEIDFSSIDCYVYGAYAKTGETTCAKGFINQEQIDKGVFIGCHIPVTVNCVCFYNKK